MMAAWCMSFLGMQPTLTQVPPRPQVAPAGEGLTKSSTATFAPNLAHSFEHAKPPDPPPITTTSYSKPWSGCTPSLAIAATSSTDLDGPI